jgi:hypothetical protein
MPSNVAVAVRFRPAENGRLSTPAYSVRVVRLLIALLLVSYLAMGWTSQADAAESTPYSVSPDVSEEDAAYVREGISYAQRYLDGVMDESPSIELVVNVRPSGDTSGLHSTAFFSPGFMVVFVGSAGWMSIAPFDRIHVIVHEYIHAYQYELMQAEEYDLPTWLIEGMAEYLSYDAMTELGVIRPREVVDYHAWSVTSSRETEELRELADRDAFYSSASPVYSIGFLALNHLMDGAPPQALEDFMVAVGDGDAWEHAFANTFGTDVDEFYRSFAGALDELIAPKEPPESFAPVRSEQLESPVTIESATSPVEPGDQLLVVVSADSGAICELRFRADGSNERIVRTTSVDGSGRAFWLVTIPTTVQQGLATVTASCGAERIATDVEIA